MGTNRWVELTVRNLGWMILSLVLALLIWIAANMANNPVEQNEIGGVPVLIDLPEGYVLTSQPDSSTVTAVVRAGRDDWDLLVPSDILVTADLHHVTEPGDYRVELEAEIVSSLHGSIVALHPGVWTVTVDREAEKRLPVQVVITNDPPLGYTYPPDIACDQTEVIVRGSAERVDAVARVEARLNLSDELNPTTLTVNLTPVQDSGLRAREIELSPASVTCPVDIQAREDVFQMPVLPKVTGNPPPGYDFKRYSNIEPDTVGVTGSRAAIRSLPGLVRTVPIDLSSRTETFTVEVPIDLPDGVTLVPENQLISVTVVIEPQVSTRPFEDVPVEVTGLDPTLFRATGLADTVTVFVSGPPNQLPERENLRVVVDLSGLSAGNHQVEPQAVITGLETTSALTASVSPAELSVTIEALNPTPTPSPTPTPTQDPALAPKLSRPTATPVIKPH